MVSVGGVTIGVGVLVVVIAVIAIIMVSLWQSGVFNEKFTQQPETRGILKNLPYAPKPASVAQWDTFYQTVWGPVKANVASMLFLNNSLVKPEYKTAAKQFVTRIKWIAPITGRYSYGRTKSALAALDSVIGTKKGNEAIVQLLQVLRQPVPLLLSHPRSGV